MRRFVITSLLVSLTGLFGPGAVLDAQWDRVNTDTIFAGTSTVTAANNCHSLILIANRTTENGTTETSIEYFINDICSKQVVAAGFGTVSNTAFTMAASRRSARLQTTTPAGAIGRSGAIDVTWSITDDEQVGGRGTFHVIKGGASPSKVVGENASEQYSAEVTGTVVGLTMRGSGQFGWRSSRTRSQ